MRLAPNHQVEPNAKCTEQSCNKRKHSQIQTKVSEMHKRLEEKNKKMKKAKKQQSKCLLTFYVTRNTK
jgi:hypothetical protein